MKYNNPNDGGFSYSGNRQAIININTIPAVKSTNARIRLQNEKDDEIDQYADTMYQRNYASMIKKYKNSKKNENRNASEGASKITDKVNSLREPTVVNMQLVKSNEKMAINSDLVSEQLDPNAELPMNSIFFKSWLQECMAKMNTGAPILGAHRRWPQYLHPNTS